MSARGLVLSMLVLALVALGGIDRAEAGGSRKGTTRVCSTRKVGTKTTRTCRRVAIFQGHNADRRTLRAEPLARPSGDIAIQAPSLRQAVTVNIYRADGELDEAVLAQLDEVFRCKRSQEVRAVDPRLYEMLSRIYDHFGNKEIELVSGFRFTERNGSRHHHASAMDIRISGVGIKQMYRYAESLDPGGMGIGLYPTSGFVHVDFRAPGDPSYRWTDLSGPGGGKARARRKPATTATKAATKPAGKARSAGKTSAARARLPTS